MAAADAYDLSDAYIQRMDGCDSVGAVHSLHTQMMTDYTRRMAEIQKEQVISKPILRAMDYVDNHLHAAMTLTEIAGSGGPDADLFVGAVHPGGGHAPV